MSNLQYNRWHIYEHCKQHYMTTGRPPSREQINRSFVGTDAEEIVEGIAEFEIATKTSLPVYDAPLYSRRIANLRERERLTQGQLGRRIGKSRMAVSSYENGTTEPNIDTLIKIADLFGVSVDSIIRGENEANKGA